MTTPSRTPPFAAQLRTRPGVIRFGAPDEPVISVKVQVAEKWDTLRFDVPPSTPVLELKRRALDEYALHAGEPDAYVMKLNGFEVLDEEASVTASGARDGSTYLLTYRHRRPVR